MRRILVWALLARGSAYVVQDHAHVHAWEATLRAEAHAESPEVPPHLVCISNLAVLYFSAFLVNILCRMFCGCWERFCVGRLQDPSSEGRLLKAANGLYQVPALCTLFLATRVWTLATATAGHDGDMHRVMLHGLNVTMYVVTSAVLVEYLVSVVQPEESRGFFGHLIAGIARTVTLAGAVITIVAIFTSPVTPSVATLGVAALLSCYFGVHTMLAVKEAVISSCFPDAEPKEAKERTEAEGQVEHVKETLTLIPMLCVLLVCLRMRALELDTEPPQHAGHCIGVLVVASCLQVAAVLAQQLACGDALAVALTGLENLSMAAVYGATAVLVAFLLLLDEDPTEAYAVTVQEPSFLQAVLEADPVPTSMKCVTMLSVLFFFVYLSVLVSRSLQYCTHHVSPRQHFTTKKVQDTQNKVKDDVMFVPMLSVLMIALRLRAFTFYQADPPIWAQYAMYVCVFTLMLQVFTSPFVIMINSSDTFKDQSTPINAWTLAGVSFLVFRYLALTAFYFGVATLLLAVWWH